jgi:hypothetical protein
MKPFILIMIFALAAFVCVAADQSAQIPPKPVTVSDDDFWSENWGPDNFPRIPEDKINQLLLQIRKENPARADELEKLRKENVGQFRNQIRGEVTKMLRQQPPRQDGPGEPQGPGHEPGAGRPEGPMPPSDRPQQGQRGEPGSPDRWRDRMERMHNDFIAWLEKNYPEEAVTLKQFREKEPDKYMERVMEKMHLYEPIMRAERSNPKLAQVMKDDLELQKQRDALVKQIHSATGTDREKLLADLKDVVSRRFDIIMARKQLQYDDLKIRLEDLQKEVQKQEQELEKLKTNKDKAVKEYFDGLVNKAEKMNWD